MEPVDYLKILRNHWKAVAALVLIAVVAVFIASPKQTSRDYSASHDLVLESSGELEAGTSQANVLVAARWVTTGEVPIRAAALVNPDASPEEQAEAGGELAGQVEAVGDIDLNAVMITATASSADGAIAIANAFGAALIEFVDQREAERIEGVIASIDAQLAQQPPPPDAPQLESERARLELSLSTGGGERVRYVTLSEATTATPEASVVSSRGQRVLLAAAVAALLGFGVAIVLDRNDSRLRSKDQVEQQFGLPVLAEVPMLGWRRRKKAAVVAFRRDPGVAEAYRGLRTALLLFRGAVSSGAQPNGNGRSDQGNGTAERAVVAARQLVVVTSAEPGDGKSTTVANLAMAHAETGQSVLIVNWDLWRPKLPGVFNAVEGPGVVDYLAHEDALLVRFVQDTAIPGVRIITAGSRGHPGARIETVRRLLIEARTLADVVIVDTAPVLSASVSRELATLADAVVVVCRAGRTTAVAAGRVAELLERIGAPTLGVVLVGVSTFGDYYGHRYTRWPQTIGVGRGAAGEGRHRAPDVSSSPSSSAVATSLGPTAAQYRAAIPKAPESEGRAQ